MTSIIHDMAKVLTDISMDQVLRNNDQYRHVQKAVKELFNMLEYDYQLYHFQSIAVVKILQDKLLADRYERVMEILENSNDEKAFIESFLSQDK